MYKALYRSYRPQGLDAVVGQDHIVKTLRNSIENNKIAHAYLFAGPRGTGKTSVAHIFSRLINTTASGTLLDISMDVIEIDAASNNGVQEIRGIIDNAKFPPSHAKYKVYIVDEVHMLTKSAWNALLKILEEPPRYVVFILATTEPHKIPITILSRTQRFNFKRIDVQSIVKNLQLILTAEGIKYDEESLYLIANMANGGMRDAISIADQASAYGSGELTCELIAQIFGVMSTPEQIEFVNAIYKSNIQKVIKTINDIFNQGTDIERMIVSLIGLLKDYIIFCKTNDISLVNETSTDDINSLEITEEFAYLFSSELISLITNLKNAELPKNLFELSILKFMTDSRSGKRKDDLISLTQEIERPKVLRESTNEIVIPKAEVDHTTKTDVKSITKTMEIKGEIESRLANDPIPKNSSLDDIQKLIEGDTQLIKTANLTLDFKVSENALLQMLLLSDRGQLQKVNEDWDLFETIYRYDDKYVKLSTKLSKQKVIAAGQNYIIVSSQNDEDIKFLQAHWQDDNTQELMNRMFGAMFEKTPILVPIFAKDFFDVKTKYAELKSKGKLPDKNPNLIPRYKKEIDSQVRTEELLLKSPLTQATKQMKLKEKTEEDELKEIFGDKFK